jgi:hypothetical protein
VSQFLLPIDKPDRTFVLASGSMLWKCEVDRRMSDVENLGFAAPRVVASNGSAGERCRHRIEDLLGDVSVATIVDYAEVPVSRGLVGHGPISEVSPEEIAVGRSVADVPAL